MRNRTPAYSSIRMTDRSICTIRRSGVQLDAIRILIFLGRNAGHPSLFWMLPASRCYKWSYGLCRHGGCCVEMLLRKRPNSWRDGSTGSFRSSSYLPRRLRLRFHQRQLHRRVLPHSVGIASRLGVPSQAAGFAAACLRIPGTSCGAAAPAFTSSNPLDLIVAAWRGAIDNTLSVRDLRLNCQPT